MKDWQVQSAEYVSADRFWKTYVIKGDEIRIVYFPNEVKVGQFIFIKDK